MLCAQSRDGFIVFMWEAISACRIGNNCIFFHLHLHNKLLANFNLHCRNNCLRNLGKLKFKAFKLLEKSYSKNFIHECGKPCMHEKKYPDDSSKKNSFKNFHVNKNWFFSSVPVSLLCFFPYIGIFDIVKNPGLRQQDLFFCSCKMHFAASVSGRVFIQLHSFCFSEHDDNETNEKKFSHPVAHFSAYSLCIW